MVVGGPAALVRALEAAAGELGVTARTDAAVREIRVSSARVDGVTLADGERLDAPVVAASCDPKTTFLTLLDARDVPPKLEHRVTGFRTRGTTAKVHLALDGPLEFACRPGETIERARTGETLDGMERAFDPVKYGAHAETPLLDVLVPTVRCPSLAPGGGHVASVIAHFAPYDLAGGWSDEARERLGDAVVGTLARYAPTVTERIVGREVLTPLDIERRYGVTGGHVHHGDHGLDQLVARPSPECARYRTPIRGLFLCGSGSHPGGGITCAPGANAAAAILGRRL